MSLILAIEPDRRQSLTLVSLSRARLNVELVLGESVGRAFEAIGPRRPDLVLTSARLTTADESTLAHRMHAFEAAGTPVPRIVIPPLSPPPPGKKGTRGKGPQAHAPTYCDPLVFSEQIADCLEMAAAERAALAAAQAEFEAAWAADVEASPPVTRFQVATSGPVVPEDPDGGTPASMTVGTALDPVECLVEAQPAATLEPTIPPDRDADLHDESFDEAISDWEELALEPVTALSASPTLGEPEQPIAEFSPVIDLDALAEPEALESDLVIQNETMDSLVFESRPETPDVADAVAPATAELLQPPDPEPVDLCPVPATADATGHDATNDEVELVGALPRTPAQSLTGAPSPRAAPSQARRERLRPPAGASQREHNRDAPHNGLDWGSTPDPFVVAYATPTDARADAESPVAPSAPSAENEQPTAGPSSTTATRLQAGWQDVLTAIRRDIHQLRGDEQPLPSVAALLVTGPIEGQPPTPQPPNETAIETVPDTTQCRREPIPWRPKMMPAPPARTVPVQDEWGFFDPQQCGFEALRTKLKEMIERSASA